MEIIDLSKNENPLGCSPLAIELGNRAICEINRYSDDEGLSFKVTLADIHQVTPEQILLGNGSSDLLNMVARTFLHHNNSAITTRCSFSEYRNVTEITGAELRLSDIKQLANTVSRADCSPKITWISNPNNPLGSLLDLGDIERIANIVRPGILLCDEAYMDFVDEPEKHSAINLLDSANNLIVTRTFSKLHGIAGLRLGYLLTSSEIARDVARFQIPMSISSVAIAACSGALQDKSFIVETRRHVNKTREEICEQFRKMGIEHIAGVCNFVSFKADRAQEVHEQLLKTGIKLRKLEAFGMSDHLRVSIGTKQETEKFLNAISAFLPLITSKGQTNERI